MKLAEFESTKVCRACGKQPLFSRRWRSGTKLGDIVLDPALFVPEHIVAICSFCGCEHQEKLKVINHEAQVQETHQA